MIVRKATLHDLNTLCEMEKMIFDHPWSENQLRGHLDSENPAYLFGSENTVQGYVLLSSIADEWEILRIAVLRKFRGRGVASILIDHVKSLTNSGDVIFLEVRSDNDAAQNLYHKMGFVESGRRLRYYSDGKDAVIMMKKC